jgi:8-hydroxy-5-deazaflavin:NADPH oxidoreductase
MQTGHRRRVARKNFRRKQPMPLAGKTIAVLGGTGAEGSGLAFRWAHAGLKVVIGSRDAAKAAATAAELNGMLSQAGVAPQVLDAGVRPQAQTSQKLEHGTVLGSDPSCPPPSIIEGFDNLTAAARGDIVVLAVPFAVQQATALAVKNQLTGKTLVDVTVPLVPPKVDRVQLPGGRSAVEQLAEKLGPETAVVAAFQNVGAHHLRDIGHKIDCDVLVCADTKAAREIGVALAHAAGLTGIHAGALANAAAVEAMTSVLIAINKAYKAKASGVRITGLPPRQIGGSS